MKAFRLVAWGQPPEFVDVARPDPACADPIST